jgi:hypothetical protein
MVAQLGDPLLPPFHLIPLGLRFTAAVAITQLPKEQFAGIHASK